tara:strand:+ start:205 stop:1764 length:1560 start_codon:yes stop_codon:yes gene_type:complete
LYGIRDFASDVESRSGSPLGNEQEATTQQGVADLTEFGSTGNRHRPAFLTVLLVCIIGGLAVLWGLMGIAPSLTSEIRVLNSHPGHRWNPVDLEIQKYIPEHLQTLIGAESGELESMEDPHEVRITNVQVVDLDGDGKQEVLVCNASQNSVIAYSYQGRTQIELDYDADSSPEEVQQQMDNLAENQGFEYLWKETLIGDSMVAPAHATVVDINQDGKQDVVVSVLGNIMPSDELVGEVVLFLNTEDGYQRHLLLSDVRRVADVQAGDFDKDGDVDLAVAVFGYARGGVRLLENLGDLNFRDSSLLDRPGVIHVPVHDYDLDGDLDIGAIVTQDEEEVWALENDGDGNFSRRLLYETDNYDVGGGGLVAADLDQDGKMDFLMSQGDNLEFGHGWPMPYHGCVWLRNQGDWTFKAELIGKLGGTYAAAPSDVDADGDLDVVLVSMSNDYANPQNPSVIWVENEENQFQKQHLIARQPVELITLDCGDVDGDGVDDIVAGQFRIPLSVVPDHPVRIWFKEKL